MSIQSSDQAPPERKPFWRCEECGHESHGRPMPKDRDAFYARVATHEAPLCPKCRSRSFMPVGY